MHSTLAASLAAYFALSSERHWRRRRLAVDMGLGTSSRLVSLSPSPFRFFLLLLLSALFGLRVCLAVKMIGTAANYGRDDSAIK